MEYFLPGRIGLDFAVEYGRHFLLTNRVISGCCEPLEIVVFDKQTGKELKNLGPIIYYSSQARYPYVIRFEDETYSKISLLNIETNKKHSILFPGKRFRNFRKSTLHSPELRFDEPILKHGVLILHYTYPANKNKWLQDKITIDLKRYQ
ncbi:hypothetical protein [Hymenobacter montanus]|nr:hypothetical protein [Hymenobacter montanus]